VSAALHISAAYPNLCDAVHRNLVRLESTPGDAVTFAELLLVYSSAPSDIFAECDASIFDGINVTSNGAITIGALTQSPGFEAFGSPWMLRGEMLLNGQTTIAPLMVDLDPTAGGGIYAKIENKRVIVTWDAVPVYTDAGNGAPSTIQVVIYKNGTIEMIFGDLANRGPDYQPDFLGNIGIASGASLASELKTDLVNFTSLTPPVTLAFGGIYEQFYVGTGEASCGQDNEQ
jgi:hypothetical protein